MVLKISAIISAHNAALTLAAVLQHWHANGVQVHMIDHGSSDGTGTIIEQFVGAPVVEVRRIPFDGVFRWRQLLELKEEVLASIDADWVLHVDADEIYESPIPGESVRGMIERLSELGFDVIDCDEFVFVPQSVVSAPANFVKEMRDYYYFAPPNRALHRAQRLGNATADWSQTGGHRLSLENRRLATERLRMRHYIGLSQNHLKSQYLGRVFDGGELRAGWHRNRVPITPDFIVEVDRSKLHNLDRDGLRTDAPETSHLIFRDVGRFKVPQPIRSDEPRKPLPFVVGVGRCGAMLLRMMLDAHPDLAMTPETHWLVGAIRQLAADPNAIENVRSAILKEAGWGDMGLTVAELNRILSRHDPQKPANTIRAIYGAYGARHKKMRVGDRTPLHSRSMCEIAAMLPEAHFIHVLRDGRDVALSYRDVWFGPNDTSAAAVFWMWRLREARQQGQFLPHYMEVRFEELVSDPEPVLRAVGNFINLPYDPVQLNAHERASSRLMELTDVVRNGSFIRAEQRRNIFKLATRPPDLSRVGRWRNEMSPQDLAVFESIAGDMLSDLGYSRGGK